MPEIIAELPEPRQISEIEVFPHLLTLALLIVPVESFRLILVTSVVNVLENEAERKAHFSFENCSIEGKQESALLMSYKGSRTVTEHEFWGSIRQMRTAQRNRQRY